MNLWLKTTCLGWTLTDVVSPSLRAELIHPTCKQWERAGLLRGTGKHLAGLPRVNNAGWPTLPVCLGLGGVLRHSQEAGASLLKPGKSQANQDKLVALGRHLGEQLPLPQPLWGQVGTQLLPVKRDSLGHIPCLSSYRISPRLFAYM